jgi:protein TonB
MEVSGTNQIPTTSVISRLLSSAVVGVVVTVVLLYLMVLLIANTDIVYTEAKKFEFCWMCLAEPRPKLAPATPPAPKKPPRPVPTPAFTLPPQYAGDVSLKIRHAPQAPGLDFGESTAPGFTDGSLTLILKVKPIYPTPALVEGLEGYVVVEYDVTAAGTVSEAWIVESSDPIFNAVAVAAVSKFLYKPRMLHGMPQETRGLKNMFKFEIQRKKK